MIEKKSLSRRMFLINSGFALSTLTPLTPFATSRKFNMPLKRNKLGKTGLNVTHIGLGTGMMHRAPSPQIALELVQFCLNQGINFYDTSPAYGCGDSEKLLGKALRDVRDSVVISTKTKQRTKQAALHDLTASLKRLNTDYVDLWILHDACMEDKEQCFAANGVIQAMDEARQRGWCKHIGIAGHRDPYVLKEYITAYPFEVVFMPLNCVDPHRHSFEHLLLEELVRKDIGVVGFKAFLMGRLANQSAVSFTEALAYNISMPVSSTLIGCNIRSQAEKVIQTACSLQPLTAEEKQSILTKTKSLAGKPLEWFKYV